MRHLGPLSLAVLEVVRGLAGVVITLAVILGLGAGGAMLFFGQAPEQVKVPRMRDLTVAEAEEQLKPLGLSLRVTGREYSPRVKEDCVVRTRPYEGKRVKRGRAIEVLLSLGPRSVIVKKVTDMDLDAAEKLLGETGLRVSEIRRKASDRPRGVVLEQVPAAGSRVGRREGVVLIASGGKGFGVVKAPDGPDWVFRRVRVTVPRGAALQRVQVILPSAPEEEQVAYDRVHRPGDQVSVNIAGRKGWDVVVKLVEKKVFEASL